MTFPRRLLAAGLHAGLVAACLMAAGAGASAGAADRRTVLVGEFGAGMASGFDGQIKAVVLREVLPPLLANLPETELGIIAFGNRPKTGCPNINVVQPLGTLDVPKASKALTALRAHRGRSPFADALTAAAAQLQEPQLQEQGAGAAAAGGDIIAIVGGPDTCKKDPCAVAKSIAQSSGGLIRIHVIGVGLAPEHVDPVRCVADNAGGRFTPVTDRAGLETALALALSGKDSPEAPATDTDPVAAGPSGLTLALRFAGKETAVAAPARWRIGRVEPGGDLADIKDVVEVAPRMDLPPGRYRVTATLDAASVTEELEVVEGRPTVATLNLAAGVLAVVLTEPAVLPAATDPAAAENADSAGAATAAGVPADAGSVVLSRLGSGGAAAETVLLEKARSRSIVVPAGTYRLGFERGTQRIERTVSIASGEQITEAFDPATGTLQIDVTDAAVLAAAADAETMPLLTVRADRDTGLVDVAQTAAVTARFELPPGRYRVDARAGGITAESVLELAPGEDKRVALALDAGVLALSVQLPDAVRSLDQNVWLELWSDAAGELKRVLRTTRPEQSLVLASGTYRVDVGIGPGAARASRTTRVEAGGRTSLAVTPELGIVALVLKAGSVGARDVVWEVLTDDGTRIVETAQPQPQLALAPGRYRITASRRGTVTEATLDLSAGETRKLEVVPQ